jgi:hypothetical protein
MKKIVASTILMLLFTSAPHYVVAGGDSNAKEWNFRVYLGDSAIGEHVYRLTEQGGRKTLVTEADFKVRFLFFTAYRYQHSNTETWQDDCLEQIESRTDANGRILNVRGQRGPQGFLIDQPDAHALPGCVKSFAYWDHDILVEDALLNPQTGELTPVDIRLVSEETLKVRGREVPARKYRLLTRDLALDVWYSDASEWLALESTTKDGRTLRYELI